MNLPNFIKRYDKVEKAAEELQIELAEALNNSLSLDDMAPSQDDSVPKDDLAIETDAPQLEGVSIEAPRQLTSHTQSRLDALGSFEWLFDDAEEHLEVVNAMLLEVASADN
jgi:hypothetical protein